MLNKFVIGWSVNSEIVKVFYWDGWNERRSLCNLLQFQEHDLVFWLPWSTMKFLLSIFLGELHSEKSIMTRLVGTEVVWPSLQADVILFVTIYQHYISFHKETLNIFSPSDCRYSLLRGRRCSLDVFGNFQRRLFSHLHYFVVGCSYCNFSYSLFL